MKKLTFGAVVLLVLAVGVVGGRAMLSSDPIYSVSQVDVILRTHPSSLVGQTIRVRGVVGFCPVQFGCAPNVPPVLDDHLGLLSPDPPLQIEYGNGESLMGKLRGLPLLGALVAPPQHLIDGYQGVLRVKIEAAPLYDCFEALCFRGILQDLARP